MDIDWQFNAIKELLLKCLMCSIDITCFLKGPNVFEYY
jgi:hypothetical protein